MNGATAGGVTGRLGAEGAVVGGVEGADSIAAWAGRAAGTSGIIRMAATMTGTAEVAAAEATARGTAFGGGNSRDHGGVMACLLLLGQRGRDSSQRVGGGREQLGGTVEEGALAA